MYRVFVFLLDRLAKARRSSELLLNCTKTIIIAIVSLAPVADCQITSTGGVQNNAGRASGGALDRRFSVKQEKEHPIFVHLKL
jgi:hypothetical protein